MKPVIFTIQARWDAEAALWWGSSEEVPVAAEAPTLDALLAKAAAQTLDLLPDNHPSVAPEQVRLQIKVLKLGARVTCPQALTPAMN
jgi:hypothetical protein